MRRMIIKYTVRSEGIGNLEDLMVATNDPAKTLHRIIDEDAREGQFGRGFLLHKIEILGEAQDDEDITQ